MYDENLYEIRGLERYVEILNIENENLKKELEITKKTCEDILFEEKEYISVLQKIIENKQKLIERLS